MRSTIKKHRNFLPDPRDINARSALFFVRARPSRIQNTPQYGLIVTKRLFKFAVDRNRAKRLLRDWITFNEKYMCKELDYIFIARSSILRATRTEGRTAMRKALNYIKKSYAEQSKN